jgi:hypothetical protein
MKVLEAKVPVQRVLEAFRNDQKVKALGVAWPGTQPEQEALLRDPRVGRPVDDILKLTWRLFALDRDEFPSTVYSTVWVPPGRPYWTLEQMCSQYLAGKFMLPAPNTVPGLMAAMKVQFREDDFVLVGYQDMPGGGIRLEDGHNRATAAILAGTVPATVKMYLSERRP